VLFSFKSEQFVTILPQQDLLIFNTKAKSHHSKYSFSSSLSLHILTSKQFSFQIPNIFLINACTVFSFLPLLVDCAIDFSFGPLNFFNDMVFSVRGYKEGTTEEEKGEKKEKREGEWVCQGGKTVSDTPPG